MIRSGSIRLFAWLLAACLWAPGIAHAAESYDNCTGFITSLPTVIATQGTWCLKNDLSTAITSGQAITINTNNVTIDCNDFKLGGLAAGVGTLTFGIASTNHLNTTIRHCNIRGFRLGIVLSGCVGGGHVVEDNRLDGNTQIGIAVDGEGSVVRRNSVFDTGGSTVNTSAEAIYTTCAVDVVDNTVTNVLATDATNSPAYGIYLAGNGYISITGNRVRHVVPAGTGAGIAIFADSIDHAAIHNNDLSGPGGYGTSCTLSSNSLKDNVFAGFTAANVGCTDSGGNTIIP